ncbi:MAG: VCBS repeat-containing protein, partial [Planctomycetaceae bacterium]|nr:VCBS repeat-containing protein [Planctomycetaceae bacterium]
VQAQSQDASIAQTLARAKTVLEPWAADIERRTRANVLTLLAAALQATEEKAWPVVLRNVRIVTNVVRPEELTQSDRLKVDRNLLEFVVPDFPPEFYEAEKLSRIPAGTPAKIQLVPLDLPPNLADGGAVLAAAVTDFDLDQRPDLIILRPGRLAVYPGQADPVAEGGASPFAAEPAVTVEVPEGFEHFQLADLDGDADPAIREKFGLCQSADEDVILYGPAGIRLLKNTTNDAVRRELVPFEPAEEQTGLEDISPVSQLALLDFDHDGDLDLITVGGGRTTLLASRGNGTFANVSDRSQLPPAGLK